MNKSNKKVYDLTEIAEICLYGDFSIDVLNGWAFRQNKGLDDLNKAILRGYNLGYIRIGQKEIIRKTAEILSEILVAI